MEDPIVRILDIRSWRQSTTVDYSVLTDAALLSRLEAVAELSAAACARLARRIMARCIVSFPFRSGASSDALIAWLTAAGAVVVLSSCLRPKGLATAVVQSPSTSSPEVPEAVGPLVARPVLVDG